MKTPPIVSAQKWEAARQQLLVKEKELTRARDALAAERRRMPWLGVKKNYRFDGPKGKVSLLDLFEGRRQLILYRAFLEPGVKGWPEHACVGCSMVADQVAHVAHLNVQMRDVCDLVGHHGAANTRMLGPTFHAGFEERAVEDQLTAALEQVEQAHFALGSVEPVILLHA